MTRSCCSSGLRKPVLKLRDGTFVKFGEETGAVVMPDYGAYRFTRIAGPTPDAPDVYSPLQAGWVSPGKLQNTERPIWTPLATETGSPYAKAAVYGEQIRAELTARNPGLLMLERDFETQSIDPVFLEPECGIAWQDTRGQKLELVLGVQSPYEAAESIAFMLGNARAPFKPTRINAQFAYMGLRAVLPPTGAAQPADLCRLARFLGHCRGRYAHRIALSR